MALHAAPAAAAAAAQIRKELRACKLHVDADCSDRKMQKKVREAQLAQYNYILVVGEQEKVRSATGSGGCRAAALRGCCASACLQRRLAWSAALRSGASLLPQRAPCTPLCCLASAGFTPPAGACPCCRAAAARQAENTVNVRTRDNVVHGMFKLDDLKQLLVAERDGRSLVSTLAGKGQPPADGQQQQQPAAAESS